MTSMLRQSKAMRAWLHADRRESLLGSPLGGLVGGYQASNDNAFLGAIEQRFLRRVECEPKPSHAQILDVGNALNQSVVNRVRLAQRSKSDSLSSHDDSVPQMVGVVVDFARANPPLKHCPKSSASNRSRVYYNCTSLLRWLGKFSVKAVAA